MMVQGLIQPVILPGKLRDCEAIGMIIEKTKQREVHNRELQKREGRSSP